MARAPQPIAMTGKAIYARIIVLETFIVALGGLVLPKDAEQRETFVAKLKMIALDRAHESGHDEVKIETSEYLDELVDAITKGITP